MSKLQLRFYLIVINFIKDWYLNAYSRKWVGEETSHVSRRDLIRLEADLLEGIKNDLGSKV